MADKLSTPQSLDDILEQNAAPTPQTLDEVLQQHAQMRAPQTLDEALKQASAKDMGAFQKGWHRGVESLQAMGYGAYGLAGSVAGSESMKETGMRGFARNIREAQAYAPEVESFRDIDSLGEGVDYVLGTLGELAPSMLEALISSGVGALAGSALPGAGTIGGGIAGFLGRRAMKHMLKEAVESYVKKGIKREAAEKLARKQLARIAQSAVTKKAAARAGAKAGVVAGVAPIEAGGNWGELITEKGIDNPWTALLTGTAAGFVELIGGNMGLLNKVLPQKTLSQVKKAVKDIELGKRVPQNIQWLGKVITGAAKHSGGEFAQEAAQELLSVANAAMADPDFEASWDDFFNIVEAGVKGAVGGAGGAAVSTVAGKGASLANKALGVGTEETEQPPPTMQTVLSNPQARQAFVNDVANSLAMGADAEGRPLDITDVEMLRDQLAVMDPTVTKDIDPILDTIEQSEAAVLSNITPASLEVAAEANPAEHYGANLSLFPLEDQDLLREARAVFTESRPDPQTGELIERDMVRLDPLVREIRRRRGLPARMPTVAPTEAGAGEAAAGERAKAPKGMAAGGIKPNEELNGVTYGEFEDLVLSGDEAALETELERIKNEHGLEGLQDRVAPAKIGARLVLNLVRDGWSRMEAQRHVGNLLKTYTPKYTAAEQAAREGAPQIPEDIKPGTKIAELGVQYDGVWDRGMGLPPLHQWTYTAGEGMTKSTFYTDTLDRDEVAETLAETKAKFEKSPPGTVKFKPLQLTQKEKKEAKKARAELKEAKKAGVDMRKLGKDAEAYLEKSGRLKALELKERAGKKTKQKSPLTKKEIEEREQLQEELATLGEEDYVQQKAVDIRSRKKERRVAKIAKIREDLAKGRIDWTDDRVQEIINEPGGINDLSPQDIRYERPFRVGNVTIYGRSKTTQSVPTVVEHPIRGPIEVEKFWKEHTEQEKKVTKKPRSEVIPGPIFSTDRATRLKEMEAIVNSFREYADWYDDWHEIAPRLEAAGASPTELRHMQLIQALFSAGKGPQTNQALATRFLDILESGGKVEYGTIASGGSGLSKADQAKFDKIIAGEFDDVHTLKDYIATFGPKVGPYAYSAEFPQQVDTVVIDRHMPRPWGYNVMVTDPLAAKKVAQMRVAEHVRNEVVRDIVDLAKQMGLSAGAVQAAIWYAVRPPNVSFAGVGRYSEAMQLETKYLPQRFRKNILVEPQAGIHFSKEVRRAIRGAQLESETQGHSREVRARMAAATDNTPYTPYGSFYLAGAKPEPVVRAKAPVPHLVNIEGLRIYDADLDPLQFARAAQERVLNDPDAPHDQAAINNAFVFLLKKHGGFDGFMRSSRGSGQWVHILGEVGVEPPKAYTFALSDNVESVVDLGQDLDKIAAFGEERKAAMLGLLNEIVTRYPGVKVRQGQLTVAQFGDEETGEGATSGTPEYGLSIELDGPKTAVRAVLAEFGMCRGQNGIYMLDASEGGGNATRFQFQVVPGTTRADIATAVDEAELPGYNLKQDSAGRLWIDMFHEDAWGDVAELAAGLDSLLEKIGVPGTMTDSRIDLSGVGDTNNWSRKAALSAYRHDLEVYHGKTKAKPHIVRSLGRAIRHYQTYPGEQSRFSETYDSRASAEGAGEARVARGVPAAQRGASVRESQTAQAAQEVTPFPGSRVQEIVYRGHADPAAPLLAREGGLFFAPSRKVAHRYAANEYKTTDGGVTSAYINLKNPKIVDLGGRGKYNYADLITQAKSAGHDGLILTNVEDVGGLQTQYVVFDASQVRTIATERISPQPAPEEVSPVTGENVGKSRAEQERDMLAAWLDQDGPTAKFSLSPITGMDVTPEQAAWERALLASKGERPPLPEPGEDGIVPLPGDTLPEGYKPGKTKKGYKLVQTKKSRPGEIFPLKINTTTPIPVGEWIPAKFKPTKGYAARPGWHLGPFPETKHLLRKDGTLDPDRVWVEVEIPADVSWQDIADKSQTKDLPSTIPAHGYYRFPRPKNQGGEWVIAGAMKVNKILTPEEVAEIQATGEKVKFAMRTRPFKALQNDIRTLKTVKRAIVQALKDAGASDEILEKVSLELEPVITIPKGFDPSESLAQWSERGQAVSQIVGATLINDMGVTVKLALNNFESMKREAYHEFWHVLVAKVLPREMVDKLNKFYAGLGGEEAAADDFRDFCVSMENITHDRPDWIVRIWNQFKHFLERLGNLLRGRGYFRPQDVFTRTRFGEYHRPRSGAFIEGRSQLAFDARPDVVPWGYSALYKAVLDAHNSKQLPKKAQAIPNFLKKRGVKPAEMEWMGIEQWLNDNKDAQGKIDTEALLAFVGSNLVALKEKTLRPGTRYSQEDSYYNEDELGEIQIGMRSLERDDYRQAFRSLDWIAPSNERQLDYVGGWGFDPESLLGMEALGFLNYADPDFASVDLASWRVGVRPPDPAEGADVQGQWVFAVIDFNGEEVEWIPSGLPLEGPPPLVGADPDSWEAMSAALDTAAAIMINNMHNALVATVDDAVEQEIADIHARQEKSMGSVEYPEWILRPDEDPDSLDPADVNYREVLFKFPMSDDPFQPPHFTNAGNLIFHARLTDRFNDRGERVLFIEEIQSDWLQEMNALNAVRLPPEERQRLSNQYYDKERELYNKSRDLEGQLTAQIRDGSITRDQYKEGMKEVHRLQREAADLYEASMDLMAPPPDAPWKNNWHEVVLKRLIRMAAEEGYDRVAWTTGQQQQDRYNFNIIEDITVMRDVNSVGQTLITVEAKGPGVSREVAVNPKTLSGKKELLRNVGKTMTERILHDANVRVESTWSYGGLAADPMAGVEVLYDQRIPGFLKKYLKQWKSSLEKTLISQGSARPAKTTTKEVYVIEGELPPDSRLHYLAERPEEAGIDAARINDTQQTLSVLRTMSREEGIRQWHDRIRATLENLDKNPGGLITREGLLKFLDRIGMTVTTTTEEGPAPDTAVVESFPITPEMTDSVMYTGQAFFSPVREGSGKGEPFESATASGGGNSTTGTGYSQPNDYILRPVAFEMPELVELAQLLSRGRLPQIRKKLIRSLADGAFYPRTGTIALRADIFQDPHYAAKILGHEVGHLVDWLSPEEMENTLKRGNILGRIASLRHYMEPTLPNPNRVELSDEDRARLREMAERLIREENPEQWIDQEITRSIPLEPDDILAIWRTTTDAIKATQPELYEYIQRLPSARKKYIVKEAMKGIVPEELHRFNKEVATGEYERIRQGLSPEEFAQTVNARYEEMIRAEIERHANFDRDEITGELKKLTRMWRPFNPAKDAAHTAYRYSSKELYADAISVLLNSPDLLRHMCPKFFDAFTAYIQRKPEALRAYNAVVTLMDRNRTGSRMLEKIYAGFEHGERGWAMALDRKSRTWDSFGRDLIDSHWVLRRNIAKVGGELPDALNPIYKVENMVYTGSEFEAYTTALFREVIKPLERAGLSWDKELGALLLLMRVYGEHVELEHIKAAPFGLTYDISAREVRKLFNSLAPEQVDALKQAYRNFRDVREKHLLQKIREAGMYSEDLVARMTDISTYATFAVSKYIEENYGRTPSAHIYRRWGTFEGVANPATATLLKDLAMIKAINRNTAAKSVAKFYRDFYSQHDPNAIVPADTVWNGNRMEAREPKDPDQGLLVYLDKGKAVSYYVDKFVAESLKGYNPVSDIFVAKFLQRMANPFRTVFTEVNYGFWMFNIFRDYQRAVMNLPGASMLNFASSYLKGIKPAFRSVFAISDETVEEMQKGNMLISMADPRGMSKEDSQIERMLRQYHHMPRRFKYNILKPIGAFWTFWSNIGRALERTNKVAGYTYLKKKFPDMDEGVLQHFVRTRAGSPDFLRQGRGAPIYNNLLLFSNAMKEGYRGDWEAMKDNPYSWWWKRAKYLILPKVLMYTAAKGVWDMVFDDKDDDDKDKPVALVQRIMQGASEYDKTNYIVVPIGLTAGGHSVYLRVPTDETGRFVGGIIWKLLNATELDGGDWMKGLVDYMAGQVPGVTPGFGVIADVVAYASGLNPYDSFRGRHVLTDLQYQAGGKYAAEQMLYHVANNLGAGIVHRFRGREIDEVIPEMDEVLGFPFGKHIIGKFVKVSDEPVLSNVVGRFLKVTDYGIREQFQRAARNVRSQNARNILALRESVAKLVTGDPLEDHDWMALAMKPDLIKDTMLRQFMYRHGTVFMEAWLGASSKAEKLAILQKAVELGTL